MPRVPKSAKSAQSAQSQSAQMFPECPKVPKSARSAQKCQKVSRASKSAQSCKTSKDSVLNLFLGHPVIDHENDQRRMNTKMIHISRDMLWNDLTSEPREAFELYRATTDPRIDAKGVMPIPGW